MLASSPQRIVLRSVNGGHSDTTSRESMVTVGQKWDKRVGQWHDHVTSAAAFGKVLDRILVLSQPRPSDVCVDLGAGTGFVSMGPIPLIRRAGDVRICRCAGVKRRMQLRLWHRHSRRRNGNIAPCPPGRQNEHLTCTTRRFADVRELSWIVSVAITTVTIHDRKSLCRLHRHTRLLEQVADAGHHRRVVLAVQLGPGPAVEVEYHPAAAADDRGAEVGAATMPAPDSVLTAGAWPCLAADPPGSSCLQQMGRPVGVYLTAPASLWSMTECV